MAEHRQDQTTSGDPSARHGYEISLDVARLASTTQTKYGGEVLSRHPTNPKILSVSDQILDDLKKSAPDNRSQLRAVFCTKCFCCTKEDVQYWNADVVARWIRFGLIVGLPVTMLLILSDLTNGGRGTETFHLSRVLGIGIALMFTFYFWSLLYQLGNRRTLYHLSGGRFFKNYQQETGGFFFKIETRLSNVDKWALMRIANSQVIFKLRAIQSISEFSAISGGQANQMIANLGPFTWVSVVMMYVAHMQCDNGEAFHLDYTDVLLVIGVSGIVMIGLFELNQFDLGMKHGHYIGVVMAMCILVAALAQGWSLSADYGYVPFVVSLVLTVMGLLCFVYWILVLSTPENAKKYENEFNEFDDWDSIKLDTEEWPEKLKELAKKLQADSNEKANKREDDGREEKEDDAEKEIAPKYVKEAEDILKREKYIQDNELREKVSKLSVQCVACEGFAIYCTTLALCWYLYHWGKTCKIGCIYD